MHVLSKNFVQKIDPSNWIDLLCLISFLLEISSVNYAPIQRELFIFKIIRILKLLRVLNHNENFIVHFFNHKASHLLFL